VSSGNPIIRAELVLFLLAVFAGAYFNNGTAWNHVSRLDTIFAFVEPTSADHLSFRIDRFITEPEAGINTGDWALYDNHYYSNKAPGAALLGIPIYFVIYHFEKLLGIQPEDEFASQINAYFLNIFVSVVPVGMALACFYRLLLLLRPGDTRKAAVLTVTLFLGTLLFPYTTQLWGHSTAAAWVIIAVYFFVRGGLRDGIASGFFAGLAVATEYSCILTVLSLVTVLAANRKWPQLGMLCLGGLAPLVVFAVYHKMCFGQFITFANRYNNPYFLDAGYAAGLFGWATVKEAIPGLTISSYRGLFVHMPVLLLIGPALACRWPRGCRSIYWLCIGNIAGYLLLNLIFNGWHGGACCGPRYQIPALPFYVLLLSGLPLSPRSPGKFRIVRPVGMALLLVSGANMFVCAVVSPVIPQNVPKPLKVYYVGLSEGYLNAWGRIHLVSALPMRNESLRADPVMRFSAFNLGELAGLRGLASLVPWMIGVGLGLGMLGYATTRGEDGIVSENARAIVENDNN